MNDSNNHPVTRKKGELLPHWTMENAIYNVCYRLAGSLPVSVMQFYKHERDSIIERAANQSRELTDEEANKVNHLYTEIIDKKLDNGLGKCYLRRKDIAEKVISSIVHFDRIRYLLHAWCIMPNHVHIIVEPFKGFELFKIIHSWKSFSANEINKELNLKGDFWHKDAYNHIIRNETAYLYLMNYVWHNPDKAGLQDWQFRYKFEV